MYDVRDIANYVLDTAETRGVPITNLSLQKLLYFVHGWFYSIYDRPLVRNKFEAWQHGPVQRVIYDQFKVCRNAPIRGLRATYIDPENGESVYREPTVDPDHARLIDQVLDKYEKFSAGQLVEQSHVEDGPWEYVWQQAEEVVYPGMKIPDSMILEHFRRLDPIITFH
ncbi:MAG TPA: type II toxin-antitoxin system antitoxin SocA domain-containing protein [Allosphingosinicella sp.]|jgi:uncharacterized phage-associated protein